MTDERTERTQLLWKNEGAAITIAGLRKGFGHQAVLHGIDLTIQHGELVALLGPSGSGKTTLLRIIAGLDQPGSGTIYFDQEDASLLSVQERRVGFVFQHYALFKHMNVFNNVAYGLKVRPRSVRPSKEEIKRRALALLEFVQLADFAKRYPAQLSGGQRQRVALARALAIEPKVLLLDEPFGALDAKVRKELRRWLREVHCKTGLTTIFVTHDQEEAMELSDRVAILNEGKIEQVGTPDMIYDSPLSPFVISFLGDSAALPAEVKGGEIFFQHQPLGLFSGRPLKDGPAVMYLRSSDVCLAPIEESNITGVIESIYRLPAIKRAEVLLDGIKQILSVEVDHFSPAIGDKVGIRFKNMHIFQ